MRVLLLLILFFFLIEYATKEEIFMKRCIAVFKSRTQTYAYYEELQKFGIYAEIVSTPREAHVGCGVSVEINYYDINRAKAVLRRKNYNAFYGFFLIDKVNGKSSIVRI